LLRLIERWRNEAERAGRLISRITLAYEAGRDGFWLARWLIARGIEAHVIHSASVAVSRERKRASKILEPCRRQFGVAFASRRFAYFAHRFPSGRIDLAQRVGRRRPKCAAMG